VPPCANEPDAPGSPSSQEQTMTPANTNRDPYAISYGAKYDRNLDIAEIAKRVRADIKALVSDGQLPRAKYSVRIDRFSGGCSLDVRIDEVPFPILNEERVRCDTLEPHVYHADTLPLHTDAAQDLLRRIEMVTAAYNYDGSDSQTDHFNVNFYGHASFRWDGQEKREREALRATYAPTPSTEA
jgi:hypothetical protein